MSVQIENPDANDVQLDPFFVETGSGIISVKGVGNVVRIARPILVGSAIFAVENGASIIVEENCILGSVSAHALARHSLIYIGAGTAFNASTNITAHEPATIRVGRNCLFGPECSLLSSDVHKIYHSRTGARLNPAGDITIGDRVWFGARALMLRNSSIGNDCVVGWASIVKGHFGSNILIAGAPARRRRKNIRWEP